MSIPKSIALVSAIAVLASSSVSDLAVARQSPRADGCGAQERATPHERATIDVGGLRRSYLVRVPPGGLHEPAPVIFVFHGRGETPEQIASYSGLSSLRAFTVFPRGEPGSGGKLSWSGTPTAAAGVDDVRFVVATLHELERTACVDPNRVFATGKSDGGGMAAQLACVDALDFRAVAPVAGAYYPIPGGCHPQRPVAVLEFHGSADRVVPYDGSEKRGLPDIPQWLGAWAMRDGCSSRPSSRTIASGVTRTRWRRCASGRRVEGYRIRDGGHTWPGASAPSGPGKTTDAVSATTLIGNFFKI